MTARKRDVLTFSSFIRTVCVFADASPCQKKSARELRQGGSDYRCCIPALAGFVSPQSIAPDGGQILLQQWHRATLIAFVEKAETLTSCDASVCIDAVNRFAWLLLAFLFATM